MSSSMDYASGPIGADIAKPVALLKTDRPDVRCPSGIPISGAAQIVPRGPTGCGENNRDRAIPLWLIISLSIIYV
jgi:hypothetical protein